MTELQSRGDKALSPPALLLFFETPCNLRLFISPFYQFPFSNSQSNFLPILSIYNSPTSGERITHITTHPDVCPALTTWHCCVPHVPRVGVLFHPWSFLEHMTTVYFMVLSCPTPSFPGPLLSIWSCVWVMGGHIICSVLRIKCKGRLMLAVTDRAGRRVPG